MLWNIVALRAEPLLVFSDRTNIRSYDLETDLPGVLVPAGFRNAIAVECDYDNRKLYVSDAETDRLLTVDLSVNPPRVTTLLDQGLKLPGGLALDYVNNNLYWCDQGKNCFSFSLLFLGSFCSKLKQLNWNTVHTNCTRASGAWVRIVKSVFAFSGMIHVLDLDTKNQAVIHEDGLYNIISIKLDLRFVLRFLPQLQIFSWKITSCMCLCALRMFA